MTQDQSTAANYWTKFFLALIIIAVLGFQWYQNRQSDSFLQPAGGRDLVSPAGLIYTMGPGDEHRLDHVMRHANDDLKRPVHGVFDGDRAAILNIIDEAFLKTKSGSKGVQSEESDNRTIFTVEMGRRIGFEGGQRGQKNNNRSLTRLRLVLQDNRVITAFPYH